MINPPKQFRALYVERSDGDFDFQFAWNRDNWQPDLFNMHQFAIDEHEETVVLEANRLDDFPDVYDGGISGVEVFNNQS